MAQEFDIDILSKLAMLELQDDEKASLENSLNEILKFFEKLQTVDTNSVEPLFNINEESSIIRKDEVERIVTRDEVLRSAPQRSDDCYRINRVVGKE
ncbi:Asp-tRNA(Asn)/Glu-tRNA(Gln) amidotransferase subunit GatC [bacterium]|nr:Asp-tRNA(Asn)/Glu-tRNA(Gln) amidotransferase subunit GatC [bacterium]